MKKMRLKTNDKDYIENYLIGALQDELGDTKTLPINLEVLSGGFYAKFIIDIATEENTADMFNNIKKEKTK